MNYQAHPRANQGTNQKISVTKSDGSREFFEEEKLANSLRKSGASPLDIDEILVHIHKELREGMTTMEIYQHAFHLLHQKAKHVAVKYSIRRALLELGPDGFPFEKFVARLFHAWKYETLVDQTVMGGCISHEIDVIAWNREKLIMVEAKYHNEFGLKSDAKVALYIQARREDVAAVDYDYGGIKRHIDEFWLITNTKFSDQAIKYGVCKGLHLIGWNYPEKGNLHDLIEENGLYPITAMASITHQQKRDLIGRGILVCADLATHPEVLKAIGLDDGSVGKALEEAALIAKMGK